jgi:hypothetical protein
MAGKLVPCDRDCDPLEVDGTGVTRVSRLNLDHQRLEPVKDRSVIITNIFSELRSNKGRSQGTGALCPDISPLWQNTKSKERNNSVTGP